MTDAADAVVIACRQNPSGPSSARPSSRLHAALTASARTVSKPSMTVAWRVLDTRRGEP